MDKSYSRLIGEIIIRWILANEERYKEDDVGLAYFEGSHGSYIISFEGPEKYGTITFWEDNCIIEEQLFSKYDDQSIFYLHYEVNDIGQCRHLFIEFYKCLIKKRGDNRFRVLISCTTGITSCIFASRLQKVADSLQVNLRVDATGYDMIENVYTTYDLLLLAPQIAHKKVEILKMTNSQIQIHRINAGDYGMMNIENTYSLVYDLGRLKQIITN